MNITAAEDQLVAEFRGFQNTPPEHMLTAIFLKYFLRDGDLSYSEFKSCFTDGPKDGGIDAITVYEQDGQDRIALIQSKRTKEINKEAVRNAAIKIVRSITDLDNSITTDYSKKVQRAYLVAKKEIDNAPIDVMICTTANPSPAIRDQIHAELSENDSLRSVNTMVFYGDSIEEAIDHIEQPKEYVAEGTLEHDLRSGKLEYSSSNTQDLLSPKSVILSISAKSLKDLYIEHQDHGLFAQNLRQFIKNKKVDDGIKNTISRSPGEFWLKNNGITIACEDYRVDGSKVVFYNFSIINGCQTATQIGQSSISEDFLVVCKVIKESEPNRMAEFAEAANAQKPIQDRDLKSNAPEQKQLRQRFENLPVPVYLGIKRGIKSFSKSQRESRGIREWQQINNKEYGQLVLAFHSQLPHIAFSQSGSVFSNTRIYEEIFHRKRDFDTEIDLLRLHDVYKRWREDRTFDLTQAMDEDQLDVLNKGRFALIANCALLIKLKRKMLNLSKQSFEEDWKKELVKEDIQRGFLVTDENLLDLPDETEENLKSLFNLLLDAHKTLLDNSENTISKLYKNEDSYILKIVPKILSQYRNLPYAKYYSDSLEAFSL